MFFWDTKKTPKTPGVSGVRGFWPKTPRAYARPRAARRDGGKPSPRGVFGQKPRPKTPEIRGFWSKGCAVAWSRTRLRRNLLPPKTPKFRGFWLRRTPSRGFWSPQKPPRRCPFLAKKGAKTSQRPKAFVGRGFLATSTEGRSRRRRRSRRSRRQSVFFDLRPKVEGGRGPVGAEGRRQSAFLCRRHKSA